MNLFQCNLRALNIPLFLGLVAISLLIFAAPARAVETLFLSFEQDFSGQGTAGKVPPIIVGAPTFQTGKVGRAMATGPKLGSLRFPSANIINPAEGTIAMWVKAVDWVPTDNAFHVFFQASGQGGIVLYKYFQNNQLLMLASQDMVNGPFFVSGLNIAWKVGEWHHIAGTWSSAGVLLFLDGEPVSQNPSDASLPLKLDKELQIGDLPWSSTRTSSSLIDEVRIFDEALPPTQIKNLFLGKAVVSRPQAPKILTTTTSVEQVAASSGGTTTNNPPAGSTDTPTTPNTFPFPSAISASVPGKVAVVGKTLQFSNKLFSFENSALPNQLSVDGKPLLATPINAIVNYNNQRTVLKSGSSNITQALNADTTTVQSSLSGNSFSLDVKTIVERDGLNTIELSLPQNTTIPALAELTIEIPLSAQMFQYRMRAVAAGSDVAETMPNTANVESTAFVPYYWLGSNDSGLFWFSDSSRYWPNALAGDAIRIDRDGSTLLFKMKLKAAGQALPAGWRYRFGLQVTPVKPLPQGWRSWRLTPAVKPTMDVIWPTTAADSMKYYGYPEATNPPIFRARVEAIQKVNRKAIAYVTPSFVSTGAPEWTQYKSQWMTGIADSVSADVRATGFSLAAVSPVPESWRNFITTKTATFVQDYKLDGLYLDNTQPYGIYNPQLNLGYLVNGVAQRDYPIFEYRELFKRVIESAKKDDPDKRVIVHMSGHFAIPMLSFASAYLSGEQFRGVVKDDYLDVLKLDQLRAEFMGKQWGLVPIFLPEFDADNAKKIEPTRGMMGLLISHDITVWPAWCNVAEVNRGLSALDRYDITNSEFIGYFATQPAATSQSADLIVSSYRKSTSDQLLVVANIAKQNVASKICLGDNFTAPNIAFTNWMTNQKITSSDQRCIDVNVARQDYMLIRVAGQ